MPRPKILQTNMTEGLIDKPHFLLVSKRRFLFQVLLGILLHVDLGEVYQTDTAVLGGFVPHLIFK